LLDCANKCIPNKLKKIVYNNVFIILIIKSRAGKTKE
jgi:hypothetical protein